MGENLELLGLPPEEWEAWWGNHPEAHTYATLSELLEQAKNRLRADDGPSAVPITEFITRHVDAVVVPLDRARERESLDYDAWCTHARALRSAGRLDEAQQADETAATISGIEAGPFVLFPQPPITEDDVRRANELIEKYGLHHLRKEG